jgi:hypothetical protein
VFSKLIGLKLPGSAFLPGFGIGITIVLLVLTLASVLIPSHVPHRVTSGCGGNGVFRDISLYDILVGDVNKKKFKQTCQRIYVGKTITNKFTSSMQSMSKTSQIQLIRKIIN